MIRRGLPVLLFLLLLPPAYSAGPPPSGDGLPAGATLRIGTRKLRHGGLVRALSFSPDGRQLASASHDRTVSAWSVPDGRELFRCTGHDGDVRCVAFSPDGQLIASGGGDATVRLWEARGAKAGQLLHTFTLKGDSVEALAFAPGGKLLACGADDGTIHLLDPVKRQTVRGMAQERGVRCLAWSADGKVLASNGASKAVTIWDPFKGAALRTFGDEPAGCLAFAPKGRRLVTWEEGSLLRLWDTDRGKQVRTWSASDDKGRGGAGAQIYQIAYSRDGKSVLCGTLGGAVEAYDPENGKRQSRWAGHAGRATALAVAPVRGLVASGGADHAIRLWDGRTGKLAGPAGERIGPVVSLAALSGRETTVAVVQNTGEVRAWAVKAGKAGVAWAPKTTAIQAAFRPDGLLFLAGEDRLRTYDLKASKLAERAKPASPITGLALSGDGTRLATTHRDGSVVVSDSDGKKSATGQGRERRILPVMSHGGGVVAGVGQLAFVPLWDGRAGEALPALGGHRGGGLAAAFTPDDRALVTGGRDNAARVWDLWTGKERRAALEHPAWICAVACSPAGVIATADVTGTIRLWSLATGQRLAERTGHRGPVSGLAFADRGRSLISAGQDATVLVWSVPAVKEARPAAKALTDARRKELWATLLKDDARGALEAMAALAADPAKTAAFVRGEVKPPDNKAIEKLIGQIDHDKFEVRDKAFKELTRLGSYARAPLKEALAKKPSLEKVRTIEKLLEPLGDGRPTGERLRVLRAVELLERIGGKDGRDALTALAKSKNAELAGQAKGALGRMAEK